MDIGDIKGVYGFMGPILAVINKTLHILLQIFIHSNLFTAQYH